jgi:hypothetical protein
VSAELCEQAKRNRKNQPCYNRHIQWRSIQVAPVSLRPLPPGRSLWLFDCQKLPVSHPTTSEHLQILSQAGLIRKRIKHWAFYKRDERAIRRIKKTVFPNVWNISRVKKMRQLLNVVGAPVKRAVLALNCFPNRGTLCAGVRMSRSVRA